jgi:type IV pilus assembly protein PilV
MNTLQREKLNNWQVGTTLIEVLISLLVLSGGMLGMAGVQSVSLRANQAAYYRTLATNFTQDIVERMRANTSGVDFGDYDNVDGLDWETAVAAAMPLGVAVVCLDSSMPDGTAAAPACDGLGSIYAIKIFWDDDRDGTADQRYTTTFQPL